MNQKSTTKNLKEFRCPKCHSLLYKYKIHKDHILVEVKCYSDNVFSILRIELEPLFQIWNQLKNKTKYENKK